MINRSRATLYRSESRWSAVTEIKRHSALCHQLSPCDGQKWKAKVAKGHGRAADDSRLYSENYRQRNWRQ